MITLPVIGTPSWGSPLNFALAALAHSEFQANDHGLLAWTYDIAQVSTSAAPTSGTIRLIKLPSLVQSVSITSVALHVNTAASAGVVGQNFVGLYSSSGTRLAQSADCTGDFATSGAKVIPLTAPYAAAPSRYYVAVLANAGTPPVLGQSSSSASTVGNFNLATGSARFANGPAAQTVLPPTITMTGITPSANATWAGIA
ncbi:hypothetical protein ACIRQP_15060 [Streptomyces sp. NPDC102274]|uniref:hypothetical protein n=1 Tax=Streptomyces sp. NPDC102274 TaxID=3366151 RepID=UPI0037FFD6EB